MVTAQLIQVVVFLAAAAIAVPLGRFLGVGSVLGYLILGAMVVVPVWFVSRLIKSARRNDVPPPPRGGTTV